MSNPLPFLLGLFLPFAGVSAQEVIERRARVMGTEAVVRVEASRRLPALQASEAALRALEAAESRLSTWRADAELARLNEAAVGETVMVSAELARDLEVARRWAAATGGAFEPSIGPLIDAWGLRTGGRLPADDVLQVARSRVGARAVEIGTPVLVAGGGVGGDADGLASGAEARHPITKRVAGAWVDAGAFGKGIAIDDALLAAAAFDGVSTITIDLGGQHGWRAAEAAVFEVADPRRRDRSVLRLTVPAAGSLATSGNSERGITVEGRFVGHVLDPRSGRPAPDFGSATIIASRAVDADCLSTACLVLGPDAALELVERLPDTELVLLIKTGETLELRASRGLSEHIELLTDGVTRRRD